MAKNKGVVIIGASGHAKVVLSTMLAKDELVCGFLDDNPERMGMEIHGFPILGNTELLTTENFTSAIIAIGNNKIRQHIIERYGKCVTWKSFVHPTAYVHPSVKLGVGTVVFAGAIIQPDTVIGDHCIINTGVTVDHDCDIGDYAHLAPGVHLAGGVKVGEGTFLGIGSVTIPMINIGDWVTVGAGGVVINDIAKQKTVIGIPAKERCELVC